jgi:hypothetical protein
MFSHCNSVTVIKTLFELKVENAKIGAHKKAMIIIDMVTKILSVVKFIRVAENAD